MKDSPVGPLLIAALLFALGAVAPACGGGDGSGLALEAYFKQVEQVLHDLEGRLEANAQEYMDAGRTASTDEEKVTAARRFFEG